MKTIYALLLALVMLSSCSQTQYVSTMAVKSGDKHIYLAKEIRLVYMRNLFFVDLKVNDKYARFLVDTGASISLLDINQAKKYGFTYKSRNDEAIGLGGSTRRYKAYGHETRTKNDRELLVRFEAADLSNIVHNMQLDGVSILGVIGSDFLMNTGAVIDYGEKKLDLYTKF